MLPRTLAPAGLGLLLASTLCTPRVHAQPRPSTLSTVEHALGASPLHSVAGHGGLSAGITAEGDVAVLTWPGPSCCDQLTLLASNAIDARSRPHVGVREGFGITLGLVITTATGTSVTWLHDATQWSITPGYADDRSLEPTTRYVSAALGLTVTVTDAVLPDRDVLQRSVVVQRDAGSAVTAAALLTHANLGLTLNVVPRLPLGDVMADSRNDFGAVWDAGASAVLHFRPADKDPANDLLPLLMPAALPAGYFAELGDWMQGNGDPVSAPALLVQSVDQHFSPGVYAFVATDPPAAQFQVGAEGGAFCDELDTFIDNVLALPALGLNPPIDPTAAAGFRCPDMVRPASVATAQGWTRVVSPAWDDAQDGQLSGNPIAAYLNDSAQRTALSFDAAGMASARALFAFGATAAEARTALEAGRALAAGAFVQADHDAWTARADALPVPDALPDTFTPEDKDRIVRAARRALLHVYSGTDRATGAIVASLARQAPYGLDWPRDGAFFDYGLDVAGDPAAVTKRLAWALPLARSTPLLSSQLNVLLDPPPPVDPRNHRRQYPEAAWEMNYYSPNAAMGGFYRFEIDNTAWMVWSAAVHVAYVPEADRRTLAEGYWEPVRRSAEMLAAWRDPDTGLNAPANEDDNAAFTSGLHGGTAVFASLEAAARLARYLDHTDEATRWEYRAAELRDALVRAFYDPAMGRFLSAPEGAAQSNPGSAGLGPTSWLVWPARMLPYSDPRVAAQVRMDMQSVLDQLRGAPGSEGGAYLTKTMLSTALFLAGGGDPSVRPMLEEAVTRLARDVLTQDTQVMGEVFITLRNADGSVAGRENRVSIPHLWEATLFALTTLALSHPERFGQELSVLPPNQTPAPGTVPLPTPGGDAGTDAGGHDAGTDASARDAGMDAGGPYNASGGCGCRAGATPRGGAAAIGMLALVALSSRRRRRRHRFGIRARGPSCLDRPPPRA